MVPSINVEKEGTELKTAYKLFIYAVVFEPPKHLGDKGVLSA